MGIFYIFKSRHYEIFQLGLTNHILSEQRIILPICSLDSISLWASAAFEKGNVAYVSVVISEFANIGQTVFPMLGIYLLSGN